MMFRTYLFRLFTYFIKLFGILDPRYDKTTKILHSPTTRLFPKHPMNRSLGQQLYDGLQSRSKQIIQTNADTGTKLTGHELLRRSTNAAKNLKKLGVQSGDIVTFCASNTDDVYPLLFGAIMAEAIINPLDPKFKNYELIHMLRIVEPQFVFCDDDVYGRIVQCIEDLNLTCVIVVLGKLVDGVTHVSSVLSNSDEEKFTPAFTRSFENDIAFIMCSSGSTGLSKAICLSQANVLASAKFRLSGNSLSFSSLYWLSGLTGAVTGTVDGASRVITRQPFTADWFFDIVEKHQIALFFGSPTHFAQILKSPRLSTANLSSLSMILSVGAALPEHYKTEMEKYVKCSVSYGMTELGSVGCGSVTKYKPGCAGTPMTNLSLRICNDDGDTLGHNETGEIQAKTTFKFLGYYKNEQATREAITSDGFYKTGDLGYIDTDGILFVVGRKKEIMKYANVAVAPLELEEILCQHPHIVECCVTGVPDEEFGSLIAALVVKTPDSLLTESEVTAFYNNQVQDAKKLRGGVYLMDSIPHTQSGKPLRQEAQKIAVDFFNKHRMTDSQMI